MILKTFFKSDMLGLAGSGLCLVHCLLMPALLCIGDSCCSSTSSVFNPDYLFLGLSGSAVFFASRSEPAKNVKLTLWLFLTLAIVGFIIEAVFDYPPYLLYLASTGLVITHLYRLTRKNSCC
jgi:hypothetical protein